MAVQGTAKVYLSSGNGYNPVTVAELATAGSAATLTTNGVVKMAALQPNAAGANPTKAEYDALLAALKAAGLMSTV